ADADLVLVITDVIEKTVRDMDVDSGLIEKTEGRRRILVCNKIDLNAAENGVVLRQPPSNTAVQESFIATSAVTGEGIAELRQAILSSIGGENGTQIEGGFLTNVRHQKLVQESLAGLDAAEAAVNSKIPHEMVLMDLYNALRPLDAITGETTADDILNLIFSTFCIGK